MAKGAKKKTKWVSLSLDGANTTTSSGAPGSDSEQHHQHPYHHGPRNKSYHHGPLSTLKHGSSKESPISGAGDGAVSVPASTATATEQEQSGHRTDTSGDSANGSGSERRQSAPYHKRRPQSSYYSDRRSHAGWNYSSSSNGGRSHYGYYGAANRRSYYDSHGRRAAPQHAGRPDDDGTASKTTTANEGGGTNTINDDEYTRITTPRQDVLFKKGYLSRPKPTTGTATAGTTASTSNENTASSSIAGTTGSSSSEGSDGGNGGGSNSISTTESITSDYGGSFAADSYGGPIPCLPYGYFTENGVLVMNGFAVDNNGYSYFNGGQTYIYPPNFGNCPQQQSAVEGAEVPGVIYTDDGTIVAAEPIDGLATAACLDGSEVPGPAVARDETAATATDPAEASESEAAVPDGFMVPVMCTDPATPADGTLTGTAGEALEVEEGCYQFGDAAYDMGQFCSSLYYQPPWFMSLYDDGMQTAAPEYLMPNGEVYTHQTGFRKRKKRFRNIDELDESGTCIGTGDVPASLVYGNATFECNLVPTLSATVSGQQPYQLNADVREFLPTVPMPAPDPMIGAANEQISSVEATQSLPRSGRKDNAQKSSKNASTAAKQCKTGAKSQLTPAVVSDTSSATVIVSARAENRALAAAQKNRRKDLIESTRAFAEQNIDLTRPKIATGGGGGGGVGTNDSEMFWTTVRKGGKKRVEQSSPEPTVTDVSHRRSPAHEESVTKQSAPVDRAATVALVSNSVPVDTVLSPPVAASPPVTTEAVNRPVKSKKKTQKHKRQHRKPGGTGGGFHRQPLEGFQLIEPEFPSATSTVQRARGCNESAPNDQRDEAEDDDQCLGCDDGHDDDLTTVVENDDPGETPEDTEVSTNWPAEVVTGDELICDMTVEDVPPEPEAEPLAIVGEAHHETVLLPLPVSSAPVAEQANALHETETEQERSTELLDNIAIPVANDREDDVRSVVAASIVDHCPESTAKAIIGVMDGQQEEVAGLQENTPIADGQVAKPLLTIAAKQRSPATSDKEDDEEDDRVERRDLAAGGPHGKRDSVSGGGYTESIDSGLQSPAPCGLASPEASSMVSSLESEPPGTGHQTLTAEPQQPLSQLVGRWLSRKLEVHDPDEVFVLPHSNPLLMERLQRFQQLQRGRDRLASDAYESEGVDDEADDDDDRSPDTDSDYMSDGQGRLDAGDGGTGTNNPNSPTNLPAPVFAGTEHDDHGGGHKLNLHLSSSTASGVLNGSAVPFEPECRKATASKRCLIM
ncbi:uncharacterized protein LOC128268632 [Anopheles cruzii]|uniref:uncharacterized protein LOC128268632 n=1 Tax=Anopheles cruzii TaxID=68878 RepID=UPI0022EC307E|nr:uncharacterized protein LOC128268632 [Anopheles cruzii]XP_052861731.1 uncharacterized protein LOC128268632 [Anopheles cruzii]XP_052861733.1 uncharacterized protein LOC128268632 [Anopheles cruzii]